MRIFQDLMPSLRASQWTPTVLRKHLFKEETESIESLCNMMMASDGEYSSLLLAERFLNAYQRLDIEHRKEFFIILLTEYDIDTGAVRTAIEKYEEDGNAVNLDGVQRAAEPRRQELFRRINLANGGTHQLVKIREDLLKAIKDNPDLKKIDIDLHHLLSAWFNRGFLLMQPIDWTTPAHILEKIIAYEAVHEIKNWDELRSRLEPSDRHCYAFFHPSMEDEPLVFVEVALTDDIPDNIGEILDREVEVRSTENPSCAIFYSISTCHAGLSGVSFGNFLIKQVATSLKIRFPDLKKFSTISPAPGFRRWLEKESIDHAEIDQLTQNFGETADKSAKQFMEKLAAKYFLEQKNTRNEP
ncbi:MAG: malonyl-CoA decarboxylase, partial [Gammaproteobacteria bacterium]